MQILFQINILHLSVWTNHHYKCNRIHVKLFNYKIKKNARDKTAKRPFPYNVHIHLPQLVECYHQRVAELSVPVDCFKRKHS